jgi:hypothetical protein
MIKRMILTALLVCGCRSTQSYVEEMYENDPLVTLEYSASGEPTFFRTRTINLDVRDCDGGRCILNMQAVLSARERATDSSSVRDGVLRFRNLSPHERLRRDASLTFIIGGVRTGPLDCVFEESADLGNRVREDVALFTTFELISTIAAADTVRGILGGTEFLLPAAKLAPLRALIDTVTASRHHP